MAAPFDSNNISNTIILDPYHQFLEEDSYPQEFKESIDSLPKEKYWVAPVYKYNGFWLASFHLYGALRFQQHYFQPQHSDVILCTLPKSGTTWMKALLFALITRKQFPPPTTTTIVSQHIQTHPLLTANPHDLVRGIEISYARENSPDFRMPNGVRLMSTHLPIALLPKPVLESKCGKIVYVCRNQKDTLVSFWHFTNKLRAELRGLEAIPFPEIFDRYCRGENLDGPFWDHILGYWKESLENSSKVLFLKYEEIKKEPDVQLRRIAEFLECQFSEEEEECGVVGGILSLCSFESLSNLEVNKTGKSSCLRPFGNNVFFRKGKVGDWRNHMTDEMVSRFDQIVEQKFKGTGLKL